MRLFLDTNILIDLIDSERDEHNNAVQFFSIAKHNKIQLFVTGDIIATAAYYVKDATSFRKIMSTLGSFISVLPITDSIIAKVNSENHPDYEDSMHIICAEENAIDAIITRDNKHYNSNFTKLTVMSESEFIGNEKQI